MHSICRWALALGASLAVPATVAAASDHAAHHPQASAAAAAPAAADMTDGEVRKVDKAAGKLTLKHGEIKSLDMPGMTMVFQVRDPAMLEALKAGDKVRFKAEKSGSALVITELVPAR